MYSFNFLDRYSSLSISIFVFFLIIELLCRNQAEKNTLKRKGSLKIKYRSPGRIFTGVTRFAVILYFQYEQQRHDKRISIIVEEANDIGTAVLRSDLYPDSIRAAFRRDFKDYIQSRIEFFDAGNDLVKVKVALDKGALIQKSLWKRATDLGRDKENLHRTAQMIPALNAMFDM